MHKTTRRETVLEISSLRELEKIFISTTKVFIGKESEHNWEERERAVSLLRLAIPQCVDQWKDALLRGIHDSVSSFIKSIHSLRTSVAIEALSLIADIGTTIGDSLDLYTIEIIILNLLKSSSVTKKLIITKTIQVTSTFLSKIHFHMKILSILCKAIDEKNIQLRESTSIYVKTMLETHGCRETAKSMLDKAENTAMIDNYLKKGFVDAAPTVRDACRKVFWVYQHYWPELSQKLMLQLEPATLRQLDKSKPKNTTAIFSSSQPIQRSSSQSSLSSLSSKTSSSSFKRPTFTKSLSAHSLSELNNKQKRTTTSSSIPATSQEIRRNYNAQDLSRLSHISNVSAPATSIPRKVLTSSIPTRRTKSDFHQQSSIASISLLHMLRARDSHMICKALHELSVRLKKTHYNPSGNTVLPPEVPSRINLLPVLMDHLSSTHMDMGVYTTLMSWECLAGIYVNVMSLNYYCPTLIIADQQYQCSDRPKKVVDIMSLMSKGLIRLKMFLKRNDPDLARRLLDILQATNDITNSPMFDSSIKRDIQLYPVYKQSLQVGLLNWMIELVCDYAGLGEDEDKEMLMEGLSWMNKENEIYASQWFDRNDNMRSYVDYTLQVVYTTDTDVMESLGSLMCQLKMANERVFENCLSNASEDIQMRVERVLAGDLSDEFNEEESIIKSTGSIQLDDDFSILDESHVMNENEQSMMFDDSIGSPLRKSTGIVTGDEPTPNELPPDEKQNKFEENADNDTGMTYDISNIVLNRKLSEDGTKADKMPPTIHSSTMNPADMMQTNRKRLTRTDSSSILSMKDEEDSQPSKRQRLSGGVNISKQDKVKAMISSIMNNKADKSVFIRLQKLSTGSVISSMQKKKDDLWDHYEPFMSLILSISHYLNCRYGNDEQRANAILLIRRLLTYQSHLFKQLDESILMEENVINSAICQLLKALISCNINIYSRNSSNAGDVIELLFNTYSPEVVLKMLWGLYGYYESNPSESKIHTSSCNPLSTILHYIGKIAPQSSQQALDQLLSNGGSDIIVKAYSHKDLSVRKSCMYASMGIHKVLGDHYVKAYLSLLRPDQTRLLMHYINKGRE